MFSRSPLHILVVCTLSPLLHAQEKDAPEPLRVRAVLHDPLKPVADLFYRDEKGAVTQVELRPKALTETMLALPADGSLVFFSTADIDPENPAASLAATARVPSGVRQMMVVVLPAAKGDKLPYRMLVIDDSKRAFPGGESRVIPLISKEIGVQAGEHTLRVPPGKIVRMPPVKKVNRFNMAQTNFYYEQDGSWTVFTERQLQFIEAQRRLFIVHATPGALAPSVSTIVDTSLPE